MCVDLCAATREAAISPEVEAKDVELLLFFLRPITVVYPAFNHT